MKMLRKVRNQKGAAMVEYGLLVALIAVVAIFGVQQVGDSVDDGFETTATCLADPSAANCPDA